jgi:hypothetical protein
MSAIGALDVTEVDVSERLEKIKSKGYWRVNIRPLKFNENRIESLNRCWEIVEGCSVSLRGWSYPVVNEREKASNNDWVQSGIENIPWGVLELWKFYKSGQFIHYFSCMEDWRDIPKYLSLEKYPPVLMITPTLYRVTEIYEFAARLAEKKVFQDQVKISIELIGMKERFLYENGNEIMIPANTSQNCGSIYISQREEISVESNLSVLRLLASAREEAIDKTIEILSKFNYKKSKMTLASDQQRLLEKRLG